jgi:hypothetical protein
MMIKGSSTRWKNEINGISLTVILLLQNCALTLKATLFELNLPWPSTGEPLRAWYAYSADNCTWRRGSQVARRFAVRSESVRLPEPAKPPRGL